MYKSHEEVLSSLRTGKVTVASVTRQMHRCFEKSNVDRWLMFARAKITYLIERKDE